MTIAKGEIFDTFAEVESALKQRCRETHQEFVVAKSEKNKLEDDQRLKECPFKLKEFKCKHHRKHGCKAFIRVNFKMAGMHKMKYVIPSIDLQHSNGCPYMTNEGYMCQSDGSSTSSASSTSQSEALNNSILDEANIVSVMAVDEEINDYFSKVPTEPKYCGLRASRLREYMQDFIYFTRSIVYF